MADDESPDTCRLGRCAWRLGAGSRRGTFRDIGATSKWLRVMAQFAEESLSNVVFMPNRLSCSPLSFSPSGRSASRQRLPGPVKSAWPIVKMELLDLSVQRALGASTASAEISRADHLTANHAAISLCAGDCPYHDFFGSGTRQAVSTLQRSSRSPLISLIIPPEGS